MPPIDRHYWTDPARRDDPQAPGDEFADVPWPPFAGSSRRSFLKAAGFGVAGALATSCSRAPVERAIPLLVKPEAIVPGRSLFYASTCAGCAAGCGVLVKTRDGRPIKIEGNPEHPLSNGALCAIGQATVLGLYDSQRLRQPLRRGQPASWTDVDREIVAQLQEARRARGAVRILTGTVTSPTTRAWIARLVASVPGARHIEYDLPSCAAVLDAHQSTHGARVLPRYRFDRAEVIVSIGADFLATWVSPVEFTAAYSRGRQLDGGHPTPSYHVQLESRLSATGSKADRRIRIAPQETGLALAHLSSLVAGRAGVAFAAPAGRVLPGLDDIASRLWNAKGRSLIVSGAEDVASQSLCNFINETLGNYGRTLDIEQPSYQRAGNDRDLAALREELAAGRVAALVTAGVNPIYDLPDSAGLARELGAVPLFVAVSDRVDETAALAQYVCPDHHFLEAWNDAEPVAGLASLTQPAIHPLGGTRAFVESLAAWAGEPRPALDLIREHWSRAIHPRAVSDAPFDEFWDRTLERGAAELRTAPTPVRFTAAAVKAEAAAAAGRPAGELALVLYPKAGMGDGRHAHNPWLQEMPDPISRIAWDNYACLSSKTAAALGVADGDVVRLERRDGAKPVTLELPAFVQPGQHDDVVAVAIGYGRKGTDRFARVGPQWIEGKPTGGLDGLVGRHVGPFLRTVDGYLTLSGLGVTVSRTGGRQALASVQGHHSLTPPERLSAAGTEPRDIVQETTVAALASGGHDAGGGTGEHAATLWTADHPYSGHRWGMVIDLAACTGCSACVVACQVENNVPVVGQDEMRRHREMHWIRIDRYYADEGGAGDVDVAFQPMLCQHCENAPCETVCPVLATAHSDEGLNEQAYNRCVGTRYCANNCPYKVRRFNWFDYPHDDRLQNLVFNPDVTVRSRGVMEKCSLCIQRIQEARMEARRLGRPIADGEITTACQQTCPAGAIVFGDLNDPRSRVSVLAASGRTYRVLEELNVKPAIRYLKVVRNRPEPGGSHV